MARVTHVAKARPSKHPRTCERCRRGIMVGEAYKWFALRVGRTSIRKDFHADCEIRQSDRTLSSNLQALYLAIEAAEDALEGLENPLLDDFAQILRDASEAVKEVAGMYEESADNIEEGFGHSTCQSEEIREKAQEVEGFADELERAADEVESLDDDVDEDDYMDVEGLFEIPGVWAFVAARASLMEFVDEQREERRQEAADRASEALSASPL